MKSKTYKMHKALGIALSAAVYAALIFLLYHIFLAAGIDYAKAVVESVIISTTAITLLILYLLGRIWKEEYGWD